MKRLYQKVAWSPSVDSPKAKVYYKYMSYKHLSERQWYEDVYDRHTVEDARRGMVYYDDFFVKFEKKLPKGDKMDRPGNSLLLNAFYMQTVGDELLHRYEKRNEYIEEWMAKDEAKDDQITNARLSEEPYCQHCSKQGLRITDKSLMHRKENSKYDDPEEVLFMLHCSHCDKTSAFWEDGTAWKPKPKLCPKCKAEVTSKTIKTKSAITFTYTRPSCKHSYKEKIDLKDKKEKPDPDYDKDRIHFCLVDKEFRDRLFEIRRGFEDLARMGKEFKEKEDNKHIYDAMEELKKPKIAELTPLLATALEKAGYTEFHLDKPEMGRDVFIGFNCLDSKSDREDYDSRKTLKKTVDKALEDTNWRLMSDGIHYRLGYLNGRIRAYEKEEDLKQLVIKSNKLKPKKELSEAEIKKNQWTIKGKDGEDILL